MSAPAKSKPAETSAEDGAPAKGGKMKLIILAVAALLVLGGGGAGAAWFLGFLGGGSEAAAAAQPEAADAHAATGKGTEAHADAHGGEAGHAAPDQAQAAAGSGHGDAAHGGDAQGGAPSAGPFFVDLPDVLVNLQSDGRRMRFLKIAVAFEVADEPTAMAVRQLAPRVLDSFQLYLRTLTIDDLRGAAPVHRMKEELLARVNQAIDPQRVEDVLVKELLVQ